MLPQFVVDGQRGPPWRPLGIHTAVVTAHKYAQVQAVVDIDYSRISPVSSSSSSSVQSASTTITAKITSAAQLKSQTTVSGPSLVTTTSKPNSNQHQASSTKRVVYDLVTKNEPISDYKRSRLLSSHNSVGAMKMKDAKLVISYPAAPTSTTPSTTRNNNDDCWLMNTTPKYISSQSKRNRSKQTTITDAFKPLQFQVKGRKP